MTSVGQESYGGTSGRTSLTKGSHFLFSHSPFPVDIVECMALREGITTRDLLGEIVSF